MIIWIYVYQKERSFPFNILTDIGSRPKVWTYNQQIQSSLMPTASRLEGTICFSYAFEHTLNLILVHNKNECSVFQMHLLSLSFHTRWLYVMLEVNIQYDSILWICWNDLAVFSYEKPKYSIYEWCHSVLAFLSRCLFLLHLVERISWFWLKCVMFLLQWLIQWMHY